MLAHERETVGLHDLGLGCEGDCTRVDRPLRRAVPAGIITLIGVGALASFKSSPGVARSSSLHQSTGSGVTAAAPPPGGATTTPPSGGSGTATATTPSTRAGAVRTIDGDPVDNPYGTVQVRVTLQGSRITNVTPLQMPVDRQYSAELSQQAAPLLLQEALQAQSRADRHPQRGIFHEPELRPITAERALDKARH